MDAIWESIDKLYGESGAGMTHLLLVDYDEEEKRALIRVSLSALRRVRASLALITKISNRVAAVHTMKISGTIKSLAEKAKQ